MYANQIFWTTIIVLACTTGIVKLIDALIEQRKETGRDAYGFAAVLGIVIVGLGLAATQWIPL